jgi:broad specificity phosphatase PhoE
MKIFLVRHASPDWHRRDIPYDILPGPMLTAKGEKEAEQLAAFLRAQGVVKLYHSPFERAAKTARIVADVNGIPCVESTRLAEWRGQDEAEAQVRARMKAMFEETAAEAADTGPMALVSHGGPIGLLLEELGLDPHELAEYRTRFDTTNPLPPAGAWEAAQNGKANSWDLHLAFIPSPP